MLTGFKELQILTGSTFLSVSKNGVAFNKNIIIKMNYPTDIKFLVNAEEKKIAIQAIDEQSDNTLKFFRKETDIKNGVRYNNRDLTQTIATMMGWNLTELMYRVDGVYIPEERAMVFDLTLARPFPTRKRSNK